MTGWIEGERERREVVDKARKRGEREKREKGGTKEEEE